MPGAGVEEQNKWKLIIRAFKTQTSSAELTLPSTGPDTGARPRINWAVAKLAGVTPMRAGERNEGMKGRRPIVSPAHKGRQTSKLVIKFSHRLSRRIASGRQARH